MAGGLRHQLESVPDYGIQITGAGGTAAGFDLYTAIPSMKTYNPANKCLGGSSKYDDPDKINRRLYDLCSW